MTTDVDHLVVYVTCKNSSTLSSLMVPLSEKVVIPTLMKRDNRKNCDISLENTCFSIFWTFTKPYRWIPYISTNCKRGRRFLICTQVRHYMAMMFAKVNKDSTDAQKGIWFEHCGHSKLVNVNVYQCPRSVETEKVVGVSSRWLTCWLQVSKFV